MPTEQRTIAVAEKSQLKEARKYEDDWTGVTSAKDRRKIQNRLHQRAWRRRKGCQQAVKEIRPEYTHRSQGEHTCDALDAAFSAAVASIIESPVQSVLSSKSYTSRHKEQATQRNTISHILINIPHPLSWPSPKANSRRCPLIPPLLPYGDSTTRTSPLEFRFPLAPDHYLITLIQYNVLRAMLTNFLLVNITMPPECDVAHTLPLLHHPPSTPPPIFTPTPLQLCVTFPSWIASVPCPTLRDNMILAATQEDWDSDALCNDVCGGLYSGIDECESRGLLVWGEPWEVGSWEVSEGFARKWGTLLKGCDEMMRGTNKWREARGEKAIILEVG